MQSGELTTHNHCQQHPPPTQTAVEIPRSHIGQVINLRPAHPEHLDKSGCQMPSTRLPHLEEVGVEKGPAGESLQGSADQPPNLRGSNVAREWW